MLILRNLIVIVIAGFLVACVHLPTGPERNGVARLWIKLMGR